MSTSEMKNLWKYISGVQQKGINVYIYFKSISENFLLLKCSLDEKYTEELIPRSQLWKKYFRYAFMNITHPNWIPWPFLPRSEIMLSRN